MSAQRRTLGKRLARAMALTTALSLMLTTTLMLLVWWCTGDSDRDARPSSAALDQAPEDPRDELLEQLAIALAIAVPLGVITSVVASRWLTRRATSRIDHLIAFAKDIDIYEAGARLHAAHDDELDELSHSLNSMFDRIALGIAAQGQFAADASHELRTPLAAARAIADVALTRPRSAQDMQLAMQKVNAQLLQMSHLVDALGQLARLQARTAPAIAIDIVPVCHGSCDTLRELAAARDISLVHQLPPACLAEVNPAELQLVLYNLLCNVIAHTPEHSTVYLSLRTEAVQRQLILSVEDQGPGVPVADRNRIFNAFARGAHTADRSRDRNDDGLGLGLAIVQRVATANGGSISVGDGRSGGALFQLRLPWHV